MLVAQWIEQWFPKPSVGGSTPLWHTIKKEVITIRIEIETVDQYGEKYLANFEAEKSISNGKIVYKYNDEYGKTELVIENDKTICIARFGEIKSKQIFENEKSTEFAYKTMYIDSLFECFTEELNIGDGKYSVIYILYNNGVAVNKITLSIVELV